MIGLHRLAWRRQRWAVFVALLVVAFYVWGATVRSPEFAALAWRAGSFAEPWYVLPIGFGACWAAPLLAREQQRRTVDLAYTQSVSRAGWLLTWIAPVLIVAAVATTSVYVAFAYVIEPGVYSAWGIVTPEDIPFAVGMVLLAVAVGLFAGAVFGRTVPAVAAAVAGILAVPYPLRIVAVLMAATETDTFPWYVVLDTYLAAAVLLAGTAWWMIRRVPRS
ncbi:hypothetical protein [Cryptosporangium aurantiacum]|uniref:ABC-2 family transporter protein n=1 Tax=Cryptosporangium aurantiacum TaxID=134849 RepID=A0A1M7RME6_9ACTN|nr:hypothetical protein [Cryptosporangium aurantiacum]SHN47505.1 hypothetical protein SAMN05443668_12463 [Cryptosporangium aurantiacum]